MRARRWNVGAADSFLRRALEGLFDTARHLLAKRFGDAGLEYRQVARACAERGLIGDSLLAARFVQMAGFRNRLKACNAGATAVDPVCLSPLPAA